MTERRSLFMLIVIVLVFAMVIPISGSADRGPAKETPIPITATVTPTPITGEDIVCFDLSTLDEVPAEYRGTSDILCVDMSQVRGAVAESCRTFDRLGALKDPETLGLEGFRGELLDLVDRLDQLSGELPSGYPGLSNIQHSLRMERRRIQELTDEELYMVQSSFTDYKVVKSGLGSVKSLVQASKKGSIEKNEGPGPSLGSFTIIPTPTPVTTPPPGIVHDRDVLGDVNEETGDLWDPAWPTDVACPAQGYPFEVTFSLMGLVQIGRAGEVVTKVMCSEKTATCPGVNIQDPPTCWVFVIIHTITNIIEDLLAGFKFCDGNAQSALIEALYHDTEIIHADLDDHDQNLTTRFNWTDKFLFDFRNLNLRLNIEANLASPDDDPHALLALPRLVCISPELETLQLSDPFAPEVIAGCGLLEVVSDTVKSAIKMTEEAGESPNNAWAEFDAAVEHYNSGEWKLAYARFRKAYREAVSP